MVLKAGSKGLVDAAEADAAMAVFFCVQGRYKEYVRRHKEEAIGQFAGMGVLSEYIRAASGNEKFRRIHSGGFLQCMGV